MAPLLFWVKKRKDRKKEKKERVAMQNLSKGCHEGQNVTVLAILEHLEYKSFSCPLTVVADNTFQSSMAPTL